MEKTHEGVASSKNFLFLILKKPDKEPIKKDFLSKKNTKFKRVENILEIN